ncbi:peptide-methionine (S)-S-oxide reductase MsrA [Lactococcus garvieae]|uniref:peptide-methionine (S)-S-oxide reductase MsrA n=1 Tax=Lactococcus garvieae TaxID=1363 RepID=UPI0009BE4060|nr:peptide-methionine (S)-S-oxide reductase MsrA [Lactococcus garvieae]
MSTEIAIFAGGCFWCMVEPFETRPGIISVTSGYTGGHVDDPTYDQVSGKYTGHTEAVEILFDNKVISYSELVELYWSLIDPTDEAGQFYDRGSNYRPAIYVENEAQRQVAEKSKAELAKSGIWKKPIVVPIEDAQPFWPAEDYHQQFYKKNPQRYKQMHKAREQFLKIKRLKNKFLGGRR